MTETDPMWQGFDVRVYRCDDGIFEVTFMAKGTAAARRLSDAPIRVPGPAFVHARFDVDKPGQFRIISFRPPGQDIPGLTRADFERKAVKRIAEVIGELAA